MRNRTIILIVTDSANGNSVDAATAEAGWLNGGIESTRFKPPRPCAATQSVRSASTGLSCDARTAG